MRSSASKPGRSTSVLPLQWSIASDVAEIEAIVNAVSSACAAAGFAEKVCRLNVPVALTEAIANAIVRGNNSDVSRRVLVCAGIDNGTLCIEVTDEGTGFDLTAVRAMAEAPDWATREDGRGVFLMHALMDKVETWCDRGHTVRLVLRRT